MPVKIKSVSEKIKAPFPERIEPMLCSLIEKVKNDEDYLYEVKFDGYRVTAHKKNAKTVLRTRSAKDYSKRYEPVVTALNKLKVDVVLDGEVVVINDEGKHDFALLQTYQRTKKGKLVYYIFDILWLNGYSLMNLPLNQRRKVLLDTIEVNNTIQITDEFEDGEALFDQCLNFGFEGIICKKKDSIYIPGDRGRYWMKVKHKLTDEFIVIGYVPNNGNTNFKTLLLGKYLNGKLHYVHHSGGGYTDKDKRDIFPKLKKNILKKSIIDNIKEVELDDVPTWTKPVMVGEFERENKAYKSGRQRHPIIFMRIRDDKNPDDVVEESATDLQKQKKEEQEEEIVNTTAEKETSDEVQGTWEQVKKRAITSREIIEFEGKKIELVNLEKGLWHGVSKHDLILYYIKIAPYILVYLKDRPLALNVSLKGPFGNHFFLRALEGNYPEWADVFVTERKHKVKGKSPQIQWLVCNNSATLIYLINIENIDIHPWNSRTQTFKEADYIVIDLDPSDENFTKVVETAKASKQILDKHKIKSFVKTSGKTGMHIYLPCTGIKYGEGNQKGEARTIAENLCGEIQNQLHDITTLTVSKTSRGEKVYVDPSQNDYADRVAAAYCVRHYKIPSVSTPLDWKEVNSKLKPGNFTIHNIYERLQKKGDLWDGLLDKKIASANSKVLRKFL